MTNNHLKGRAIALLPIAVFLLFFIGSGLITGDFYSMPAIVGFLIALIIASPAKQSFSCTEAASCFTGVGDENILTMCLIFLPQVPFRATRCRRKHRQPRPFHSVGQHGAGCRPFAIGHYSISMGTSVGTITALAPIAADR